MELNEAILKRRSIRKFNDKIIDDQIVDYLLHSAMAAPSARNKRPWEFYVVRNDMMMNQVREIATYLNYNATLMILVCGNLENSITKTTDDFWIQDCSAAIENILLSSTELGIGTVWCGVFPNREKCEKFARIFNLPENTIPLGLIQMGYTDEEFLARSQYEPNKVHFIG